jgi:crotonobetainyl-CoA:carnitine CoA-transferase CaiB-like acyl-CoA transferase
VPWASPRGRPTARSRPAPAASPGWTRSSRASSSGRAAQNAAALAAQLQAAGVDATRVEDFGDLHDDPQLAHRHQFPEVEHAVLGRHPVETHAMRFSAMAPSMRLPAPRLGEHTEHVLVDLLGMARGEYEQLRDAGVFE